jgi:hypothetical protein
MVCPFFRMKYCSGNSRFETGVYGVHSSLFMMIGFILQ